MHLASMAAPSHTTIKQHRTKKVKVNTERLIKMLEQEYAGYIALQDMQQIRKTQDTNIQ